MSAITRLELKLTILLVCTLCLITADAVDVIGYAGGRVLIKCKYKSKLKSNTKYFCKGYYKLKCDDQIRAGAEAKWINRGQFSLFDDVNSTAFSVMIKELSVKDSGNYWCAIDIPVVTDEYTPVRLIVEEGQSYVKFSKTVHVGEDVNITCKFPEQHRSHPKFFCQRSHTGGCAYKLAVKESRKFLQDGRFMLYDDRAKQMFNVTLKNVTNWHSGEYWCGAEVDWNKDHGYKVYITQVNLRVSDVHDLNVLPLTSTTKGTRTIARTKSRTRDSSHRTSTVPSLLSSSTFSSSSPVRSVSESGPASSETEFPVSTVVTVSVLLVLFAVGTSFLIVILQKRKKKKASVHTHSVPGSGNNHEAPPAVRDYEEIDDSSRVAPSASDPSALYSTPRPPTNLSGPPVYANAGLPTTPCDSSNTIYATAQLPINKQKFPEQDFSRPATSNSQAQQSVQRPAVGPVYASVSFHRSNSNGAGPKVIFKKEDISCDYSIVRL